ncbi:unnamed protein product [Amoebophrya sp. A25]|nr:unnamed protein product [Amoebophrya sp. A25]|eukprot:GSA25T00018806001.1
MRLLVPVPPTLGLTLGHLIRLAAFIRHLAHAIRAIRTFHTAFRSSLRLTHSPPNSPCVHSVTIHYLHMLTWLHFRSFIIFKYGWRCGLYSRGTCVRPPTASRRLTSSCLHVGTFRDHFASYSCSRKSLVARIKESFLLPPSHTYGFKLLVSSLAHSSAVCKFKAGNSISFAGVRERD